MNNKAIWLLPLLCASGVSASLAQSAPDPAAAQARYQAAIAHCNSAGLPTPARQGCVRNAGAVLDGQLGGPPPNVEVESNDGRAVIVEPIGDAAPVGSGNAVTTGDGRAVVILPANRGR